METANLADIQQAFVDQFQANRQLDNQTVHQLQHPSMKQLHDFRSAEHAIDFVRFMHANKDKVITIFGDYDADGVLSATVAYEGLKLFGLGRAIHVHIPTRQDGYGISTPTVKKLLTRFPDTELILTVDNGVVGFDGINYAKSQGVGVAVTDHHLGVVEDTNADVVVDINRPTDTYEFKGLSGTGVIWKLWHLYAEEYATQLLPDVLQLCDLVGVSVVSDVMPVIDENRAFLVSACRSIQKGGRVQWRALREALAQNGRPLPEHVDEQTIGFTIAPLINSANRVTGSPELPYRIFMSNKPPHILADCKALIDLNNQRKSEVNALTTRLIGLIADQPDLPEILVVVNDMPAGYMGLVANNLMNQFNRPVIVGCELPDGTVVASGRSRDGVNLVEILRSAVEQGLVIQAGGHAQACGLSFNSSDYNALVAFMDESVKVRRNTQMLPNTGQPTTADAYDLVFTYDRLQDVWLWHDQLVTKDVLIAVVDLLKAFAPYGQGLPAPQVNFERVYFSNLQTMSAGVHSKFKCGYVTFIRWHDNGGLADQARQQFSIAGQLDLNFYRGSTTVQVLV